MVVVSKGWNVGDNVRDKEGIFVPELGGRWEIMIEDRETDEE